MKILKKISDFLLPVIITVIVIVSCLSGESKDNMKLFIIFLVMLGIFALYYYDLFTGNISNFVNRYKKSSLVFVTAAGSAAVFLICIFIEPILAYLSIDFENNVLEGRDLFGYYIAQLSLTFISISVLSVLSDKSVQIYWANVSEDRLIKPTFSCFAAYTYYSIGASIGSGVGVVIDNGLVFAAFFAINILVMIVLTLSMIDVYYGRDAKINKLRKELKIDFAALRRCERATDADAQSLRLAESYRDKILGLRQHIYNADANSDLTELREIYLLYAQCSEYFYSKDGETAVTTMVETVDNKNLAVFLTNAVSEHIACLLEKDKEQTRDFLKGEKLCYTYLWDVDRKLWQSICENRFLSDCFSGENSVSKNLLERFLTDVNMRMAMLYNRLVIEKAQAGLESGKDFDAKKYLAQINSLGDITVYNSTETVTKEKITEIFEDAQYLFDDKQSIVRSALKIMKELTSENSLGEDAYKILENFPFFSAFCQK